MKNHKNLDKTLDFIHFIKSSPSISIKEDNHSISSILEKKSNKGFEIALTYSKRKRFKMGYCGKMIAKSLKYNNLNLEKPFLKSFSLSSQLSDIYTYDISNFYINNFHKKTNCYFRLCIPVTNNINFFDEIEHFQYQTSTFTSSECIRIKYSACDIDLYFYNDKQYNQTFLIIDSTNKFLSFKEFEAYCTSTLIAFGYITGHLILNEAYYFSYKNQNLKSFTSFLYTTLSDSIISEFTPITSNPSSRLKPNVNVSKKELRYLYSDEFSKLCDWVNKEPKLATILLLILESMNGSLHIMPSGLSVALEAICGIFFKSSSIKVPKDLTKDLKITLKNYEIDFSPEDFNTIEKKLENLHHKPNSDKLTLPFFNFGFHLSQEDKKAINKRNLLLHGNINITRQNFSDFYHTSIRLYTLINVLILKEIGYNGRVINYPKIYNLKLKEDFFKKI